MADTEAKEAKISIKVIVDKVNKRVVYAEADYTFVDILFSFMTLPMGTIVRLLGKLDDKKFEALGSFNNLYQSLKELPECYFSTEECKSLLLNPRSLSFPHCRNLKLNTDDTEPLKHFRCGTCSLIYHPFFSTCAKAKCRTCVRMMDAEFKDGGFSSNVIRSNGGVFVSDITTFIVTDDLCVVPYSFASSIRLLTDRGIADKSCLENIKLDMGCEQMISLLKTALSVDSVFTYLVFQRTIPIRDLVVPDHSSTSDQTSSLIIEKSSTSKIHLEVSLQKSTGKLLFAEAKEDFVDFLFGFLSIPLGTVIGELVKGVPSLSCMENILKSISNVSVEGYLKSQDIKYKLLKPHIGQQYSSKNQVFPLDSTPLHRPASELKDPRLDGGLLKRSGMFIVTDDLIITPSSSDWTMSYLSNLNVSFDDIEKHEISVGLSEGLRMLKASLESCSTLTNSLELHLKK